MSWSHDAKTAREIVRQGLHHNLPKDWDKIPFERLWSLLNDPNRFSTSQATIEAILSAVRQRGKAALEEPRIKERLAGCDEAALEQINERLNKLGVTK